MADNTTLNTGTGGDTIRDLARQAGTIKTQVTQIDIGGASANAEVLVTAGQQTMAASLPVVIASNQPPLPVTSTDTTATGALTAAAQTVALALNGNSAAAVQVSGTWIGTLQFEGSADGGATYSAVNAVAASTSYPQPTTSVNGLYRLTPAGLSHLRVNMTAFTSGSASITIRGSIGVGGVFANQIVPSKITDGVSNVAIKAASTAAVSTDAAIVVSLSPNSPAPSPANASVLGTLSATDAAVAAPIGDGTLVSGASTVGSVVAIIIPDGAQAWTLLIKGYVSGAIYTEASNNSTNGTDGDWVEVKGRRTGTAVGIESVVYTMVANGYYRGNAAGFKYIRARLIGGTGPTIQWMLSNGQGATFLNSGIPAGSSILGKTGIDQTTPGTTNLVSIGTNGTVAINTALPPGANVIGALTANQSVNIAQVNGIAPLTGNGVTGPGAQRVTIASDNAAFAVTATLAPETTKVIGTVNIAAAQTIAATQATAANLNATIVGTGTFAVQAAATLAAETSKVIGTVNIAAAQTISAITAITNALPAGANILGKLGIDQTTPGTTNLVSIGASVKAASTASVATDASLVIALSPNSPLPAGTNNIGTINVQGQSITGVTGSIAAAATGTVGPLAVGTAGNATFTVKNTIAANPYGGTPVLVFEQSDDNSSWGPLAVTRSDTGATLSTVTLAANSASASLMFDVALEGVNWVRCRVTTGPVTNALSIVIQPGGLPFSPVVSVIQQPLLKGTQGISGVATQDLKDSGRNQVHYYTLIPVLSTATDTLQTLTGTKAGATILATATPAVVTTGKTFRVTRLTATYIATATAGFGVIRLRFQPSGVVTITSPVAATLALGTGTPGTANATGMANTLDEGWEFAAGVGVGISVQGFSAITATAVGYVMVSITGYEY
jgi:hypothetical protein